AVGDGRTGWHSPGLGTAVGQRGIAVAGARGGGPRPALYARRTTFDFGRVAQSDSGTLAGGSTGVGHHNRKGETAPTEQRAGGRHWGPRHQPRRQPPRGGPPRRHREGLVGEAAARAVASSTCRGVGQTRTALGVTPLPRSRCGPVAVEALPLDLADCRSLTP